MLDGYLRLDSAHETFEAARRYYENAVMHYRKKVVRSRFNIEAIESGRPQDVRDWQDPSWDEIGPA